MNHTKRNFAFISYNQHDVRWAKWLRRKLEWYRLPSEIHNEFEDSQYIRPVFRDRDALNSGVLGSELRKQLEASKYLIVICSQNSAKSHWVSDEVQAFIDMGRLEFIIPFIVDGNPQEYSCIDATRFPLPEECFPKALREWNFTHPSESLLGIAITDDGAANRQKAFIRVVSRLLELDFDTLWQRHKRERRVGLLLSLCAASLFTFIIYWFGIPVQLSVGIRTEQVDLPEMEYGTIRIGKSEYAFRSIDTTIMVDKVPGYRRFQEMPFHINVNRFYHDIDSLIRITGFTSQSILVDLKRDDSYMTYAGFITNMNGDPIDGVCITIEDKEACSDSNGHFSISFPLSQQTRTKRITLEKRGYTLLCREDECPSTDLRYILKKAF